MRASAQLNSHSHGGNMITLTINGQSRQVTAEAVKAAIKA
jgi:hypothetical protein